METIEGSSLSTAPGPGGPTDWSAALAPVLQPTAAARGLPNPLYTDSAVFAEERRRILWRSWSALAFAHDVAQPGSVYPVDHLGLPLMLVRRPDGTIAVFHNVCSHRGMRLVDQPGRLKGPIRCPYHSWTYDFSGALRATPSIGGDKVNTVDGFDPADHGLRPVRSVEWFGVVFVDLSGQLPDFATLHAPLMARWADLIGTSAHHPGGESAFELTVACNWKLAVENYCESYHLPWVHPGLNSYSRLADHYDIRSDATAGYSGQGTMVYRPMLGDGSQAFPVAPGLGPRWDTGAEYVGLYPNVLLGAHKDHTFAILLEPHAPDRTGERVALFYFDDAVAGPDYAALRTTNARMWRQVFEEDIASVEGMQRGRASPAFGGGVFSPVMDGPTHDFHRWMATRWLDA